MNKPKIYLNMQSNKENINLIVYIWVEVSFEFQLLGEYHCWWTGESPRAHVAKFYGRLRLTRSVLRASHFPCLRFIEIVILWVYYTIHFGSTLFCTFRLLGLSYFKLLCLAKDHFRGFSTQNAHMIHVVNLIRVRISKIYQLIKIMHSVSWFRNM